MPLAAADHDVGVKSAVNSAMASRSFTLTAGIIVLGWPDVKLCIL